jgi:uncharacterized integral membrane protein
VEGQPAAPEKRERNWTLIVFAVLAVYGLVLVLLNKEKVKIDFVFFSTSIRLLVLIILCLVLGFAGGLLFEGWRVSRKR